MRVALAACVALAALAVARADAQTAPPAPAPAPTAPQQPAATIVAEPVALLIAACDADRDARVTRAELSACIAASFAGADPQHTGSIGYIAYADWALKWLGDRNALPSPFTVDADHDDRITLAELQARFDTLFTRFDLDKDGVLTRAELVTIRAGAGGDDEGRGRRRRGSK